jgi:hypothetical protein
MSAKPALNASALNKCCVVRIVADACGKLAVKLVV